MNGYDGLVFNCSRGDHVLHLMPEVHSCAIEAHDCSNVSATPSGFFAVSESKSLFVNMSSRAKQASGQVIELKGKLDTIDGAGIALARGVYSTRIT